jgi:hypothetical protein
VSLGLSIQVQEFERLHKARRGCACCGSAQLLNTARKQVGLYQLVGTAASPSRLVHALFVPKSKALLPAAPFIQTSRPSSSSRGGWTSSTIMAALVARSVLWLVAAVTVVRAAGLAPSSGTATVSTAAWGADTASEWPLDSAPAIVQGRRLLQLIQLDGSVSYTMPSNATVFNSPAGSSLIDILGPLLGLLGLRVNRVTVQPSLGSVVVQSTGSFVYTGPAVSFGGAHA